MVVAEAEPTKSIMRFGWALLLLFLENGASQDEPVCDAICPTKLETKYDYSYYTTLGDSPGIPGVEYLGIGYDICE